MSIDRRQFLGALAATASLPVLETARRAAAADGDGSVAIVAGGEPMASLVVGIDPDEQVVSAAQALASYVAEATGATLPVVASAADITTQNSIYLGLLPDGSTITAADIAAQGPDGFVIDCHAGAVTIIGPNAWGTRYGAYEFLRKHVQVRWLMPDAVTGFPQLTGSDVPDASELAVPQSTTASAPAFAERVIYPYPQITAAGEAWNYQDPTSDRRVAMNTWGRFSKLRHVIEFNHNLWSVIPVSVYGDPTKPTYRPDFFPLRNGSYQVPRPGAKTAWQPRFSADGIAEAAAQHVLSFLRSHPDTATFSLAVNDSGGFSDDDVDRVHLDYFGLPNASEAYYGFVNSVVNIVAAEFPDVIFGVLAYINVSAPPSFTLHPNIVPFLTRDTYGWVDDEVARRDKDWIARWGAVATQIGLWDYSFGSPYCLPRSYLGSTARTYRHLRDANVMGVMTEMVPYWGEGPRASVLAELLWDPDQDPAALVDEWCARAVGEAAGPHVAEYFRLWDDFWSNRAPQTEWFHAPYRVWYSYLTAEYLEAVTDADLARSRALLSQAEAQTPEQATRLDLLRAAYSYYEATALSYPKRTAPPSNRRQASALLERAVAELDRNISLAERRLEIADELIPATSATWGPQVSHLVWSGWNLYTLWDLGAFVRDNPADGLPIRRRAGELASRSRSDNVRSYAQDLLAVADGRVRELGQNMSFDDATLAPWVFTATSGVRPSAQHALDGAQSMLVPGGFSGRVSQLIPVSPGPVRFEAHIYTESASARDGLDGLPPYGYYAKLWLRAQDASGAVTQQVVRQFSLSKAADNWYQIAATEILNADVSQADCWIVLENTRDVWVDKVSLTQLR